MFKAFTVPGFYSGLMLVQIVGLLFIHACLKETKGKTKEECEKLYSCNYAFKYTLKYACSYVNYHFYIVP